MSLPGYQSLMMPFLEALADGREHAVLDCAYLARFPEFQEFRPRWLRTRRLPGADPA